MTRLARACRAFLADKRGATAIEYGLVATFIALACLTTIQLLGANVLTSLYEQIVNAWDG
jgi:Flp pilus assembly pilin Flp